MARTSRIELNRRALNEVAGAIADGVFEVGKAIIEEADPPDATPYGKGLVTQGGVLAYHGSKMIGAWSLSGDKPKKPRKVKVKTEEGNVFAIVGFGFPGRFQEGGTINHPAQPFLTPAVGGVGPRAVGILDRVVRPKLMRGGR
jgi:hypothetical protein